jgi:hypothetical protein
MENEKNEQEKEPRIDEPLGLDVIAPEPTAIVIWDLNGTDQIELVLRPLSVQDQMWVKSKFSQEQLQVAFEKMDMEVICALVYHQLDHESKSKIPATETESFDDEGNPTRSKITGPQRLKLGITGLKHMLLVLQALIKIIGFSMPLAGPGVPDPEKKSTN